MSLSKTLSFCFSPVVRDRGAQYFSSGKVKIQDAQDGLVLARVQGTRSYGVGLAREDATLFAFCDCDYFEGNHLLCKHIWSVLLAVESRAKPVWAEVQNIVPDEESDDAEDGGSEGNPDQAERPPKPQRAARVSTSRSPSWKIELGQIKARLGGGTWEPLGDWPAQRRVHYLLDFQDDEEWQSQSRGLEIELSYSDPLAKGGWSKPRFRKASLSQISSLPPGPDREILALLCGVSGLGPTGPANSHPALAAKYRLQGAQLDGLLPMICATGRCLLATQDPGKEPKGLAWDHGAPWDFRLEMAKADKNGNHGITGRLEREGSVLPLPNPALKAAAGLLCHEGRLSRLRDPRCNPWIRLLQEKARLDLPTDQAEEFLRFFFDQAWIPAIKLPEGLNVSVQTPVPKPSLTIQGPRNDRGPAAPNLIGEVSFSYNGVKVLLGTPQQYLYQPREKLLVHRDQALEQAARARLAALNFTQVQTFNGAGRELMQLPSKELAVAVRELVAEGWNVEAQGKVFRQASKIRVEVTSSGMDWFDLSLGADFEGQRPGLPELLAALKRRDGLINLADGSLGVLPAQWLERYGLLAGLGTEEDGRLRFKRTQAGLLDLLLAEQQDSQVLLDAGFKRALKDILRFDQLEAAHESDSFQGELRPYQREGLAWMLFLQKSGFGGCLADDMGLGKTVQVLALLEARRTQKGRSKRRPSLLVVPKSLVFNWQEEALRFTPGLRLLPHLGPDRAKSGEAFDKGCDVVLTTYGTLRQDILFFKDLEFDYLVLDESQAAKNSASDTAKAIRLLKGEHRLALSGTPVENHLGELWSLLEFLNPGLLGSAASFRPAVSANGQVDPETLATLAKALRPFILRRTKDKVAKELPAKVEKTLFCELEPEQRRLYTELRDHYRESLLKRVEKEGLAKSKMWVLEALLRLRQAACHPGLVDKSKLAAPCAKLETLLPRLQEVMAEGHKALVFSQFTSFLDLLRIQLNKTGVLYEYLDGKTQDRKECVERFQTDPERKLFLISLKAGGVGLNLTAADYVFLLDPWWNPAVEAQALDRAHRIGQTRQVFAYRLIAKDTVEEKVLQLQETKRRLADGILNADESVMGRLTREDLEILFS